MIRPATNADWIIPFGWDKAVPVPMNPPEWGVLSRRLLDLCELGLPVSPGFLLTGALARIHAASGGLPEDFDDRARTIIVDLERQTGLTFGSGEVPLLLDLALDGSAGRSGGISCIGLNLDAVAGLARRTGNARFAWGAFHRLLVDFAVLVHGCSRERFDRIVSSERQRATTPAAFPLGEESLRRVVHESLGLFELCVCERFPADPYLQLRQAVEALLLVEVPRVSRGPGGGTESARRNQRSAVVRVNVPGCGGSLGGAGVAFTRDPVSGRDAMYVDFLSNAVPEDLRSGVRAVDSGTTVHRRMPWVHDVLVRAKERLEETYRDMLEIEFIVEDGQVWITGLRPGRRSVQAALRIAFELVKEGRIGRREALELLRDVDRTGLRQDRVVVDEVVVPLATALPASAGVVAGRLALGSEQALRYHQAGSDVVLVCEEQNADDLRGLAVARGLLITGGGRSSRAAVMARRIGIPCIAACTELVVDPAAACIRVGDRLLREGDQVTVDGHGGRIYAGSLAIATDAAPEELTTVRRWIFEEDQLDHPLA